MSRYVQKTIYAKKVRFRAGRKKEFVPIAIDEALLQLKAVAPVWSKRHWPVVPPSGILTQGISCSFIRKIGPRPHGDQRGVYFEVGSYVNGHAPDQIALDFAADEPDITTEQVRDSQGKIREIVTICRCVALGETVLVENVKGSGGVSAVEKLLSRLFQCMLTFGNPARAFPGIELLDVANSDLRTAILRGRGVQKVVLRMIENEASQDEGWTAPLKAGKARVGNAARFSGIWESSDNDALNTDDVIDAVNESLEDDSPLDRIMIELRDGNRINGVGSYKARHQVPVTVDNAGLLHYSELIEGLWSYLDELRIARNGWRLINDSGVFNSDAPVTITSPG